MIKDLGLAATSIFGLFIAVFIGIGLVSKEVERRSIYSVLSKPITRSQLLLGKYLGLVLTLAVNLAFMAAALFAVLAYMAWMAGPAAGAGLGGAGARSGDAQGGRPHLFRARHRDGHRAVLLDLLDADAVGGVHHRPLRGRPVQRRPRNINDVVESPAAACWRARSTGSCRTWRRSTSAPRSCTACRSRRATWR